MTVLELGRSRPKGAELSRGGARSIRPGAERRFRGQKSCRFGIAAILAGQAPMRVVNGLTRFGTNAEFQIPAVGVPIVDFLRCSSGGLDTIEGDHGGFVLLIITYFLYL